MAKEKETKGIGGREDRYGEKKKRCQGESLKGGHSTEKGRGQRRGSRGIYLPRNSHVERKEESLQDMEREGVILCQVVQGTREI